MTREAVIQLIMLAKNLDQKDAARVIMLRENENHPEWNLLAAIKQAMEAKA